MIAHVLDCGTPRCDALRPDKTRNAPQTVHIWLGEQR